MQFLYNENREVVAEKDYSGNIIRYIRGLGLISSDSENAKTYYHYVCDEQGSVSRIIRGEDKENGAAAQDKVSDRVLNHYEYDAFGNTISCEERVANRFRYQTSYGKSSEKLNWDAIVSKKGETRVESGSKTIDDIIDGLPETTNGKGVARNFESTGDFEQTIRDFDALNPIDVKEIQTKYGSGKVGKLSDGTTVVARPGSTTGGATLEIRVSNRKVYKIRY